MKRRGFLGAMLASFTAPYVMANAIERGVIMPVQPKVWTPSENVIETSVYDGPMIRLYTAGGILLASIPLNERQQALFDYGRKVGMDFTGQGGVIASGIADRYELDLGADRRMNGKVGDGFRMDNTALVVGQDINIPAMNVMVPKGGRLPQHGQQRGMWHEFEEDDSFTLLDEHGRPV